MLESRIDRFQNKSPYDDPCLAMLTLVPDPLRWSVGDAHADRSKTRLELPFVPVRQLMVRHLALASSVGVGPWLPFVGEGRREASLGRFLAGASR